MIKFKKNQEIVYDATFVNNVKDVRVRFVITESKILQKRNIPVVGSCEVCKTNVSCGIYNLYRIDYNGNNSRKLLILTSGIISICMNAIIYILDLNKSNYYKYLHINNIIYYFLHFLSPH